MLPVLSETAAAEQQILEARSFAEAAAKDSLEDLKLEVHRDASSAESQVLSIIGRRPLCEESP